MTRTARRAPSAARRRSPVPQLMRIAGAVVMLGLAGCDDPATAPPRASSPSPTATTPTCTVSAILVPSCGVWWGAAANPSPGESWDEALPRFESTVGRTVDIAHYYNSSPKLFPTADMIKRAREPGKNRILLLNWKPEMGRTWAQVAAGDAEVDAAIDREADYLTSTFREQFFLAVHHEPENEVVARAGSGMTAQDYRAMYRHVVTRLRTRGVTNAVTVMNYVGTPHWGSQPWFGDLYPGDDVVDWIAEDPYIGAERGWSAGLAQSVDRTMPQYPRWRGFYTWATTTHPAKPIMLAEWGVTQDLPPARRNAILSGVPDQLGLVPRVKAIVYWNSAQQFAVGVTELRPGTTAASAFGTAMAEASRR